MVLLLGCYVFFSKLGFCVEYCSLEILLQLCIKIQTQCNLAEPEMLVTMLSDVTNSVVGFIDLWGKRI